VARKTPEERRDEILRAAGEVVLREGFGRTSVRELAAAVGVSPGLLHHYFPSMDEILVRAVELFSEEDLEQLAAEVGTSEDADPLVRLDRVLRWCVPVEGDPSCRFWVESWAECLRNPGAAGATSRLNDVWLAGLRQLIEEAVATGAASCSDPDGAARRLLALIDGLTVQVLVHHGLPPEGLLTQSRVAAELELGLEDGTLAALGAADVAEAGHRRVRVDRSRT
jgi:AcrR family transcriptional regulator